MSKYNFSFLRGAVTGCALTTLMLVTSWLVFRGISLSLDSVYGREAGGLSLSEGRSLLGFWGSEVTSTTENVEAEAELSKKSSAVSERNVSVAIVSETASVRESASQKKLLVVVTTSRILLERTCSRIRSTWGRETVDYRVVVGAQGETATSHQQLTSSPNVLVSPSHSDFPAFPHLTLTNINSLLNIVRSNFIGQYKWFLFAPSNLYISVQSLERFLQGLNPNRVVYIGYPNSSLPDGLHYYCEGGPGIVLSSEALSRLEGACSRGGTEPGYRELGRCFQSRLNTECSLGNNVSLREYFVHNREAMSLNPELLWKNKTTFGKMLTLYPIRDLDHMETVHAFSQSREILHHQDSTAKVRENLLENDVFEGVFPRSFASFQSLTLSNGSFDNFTRHCHIPGKGYIPEIRRKVVNWETVTGHKIFNSWNLSPLELVHGDLNKELQFITTAAMQLLRNDMPRAVLHGVPNLYIRYKGTVGREYILDMTVMNGTRDFVDRRISLLLPHKKGIDLKNDPSTRSLKKVPPSNLTQINFIVPLDGLARKKVAKFQRTYYMICVRKAENCRLIYVIYGSSTSDINFMRTYLTRFKRRHPKFVYEYVVGEGKFNLTKAYDLGLSKVKDSDLAFIASPDLSVADHFMNRCRRYTSRGAQIYYPELFMYYNMPYVYRGKWHPRNYDYSRLHGRWTTHAIICAYKSDYVNIGGYTTLKQWEMDPSSLHTPVKGSLEVMKGPDPGISHWYEATHCDSNLPPDQFSRCHSTQSDNLADRLSLAGYMFSLEAKCGGKQKSN